MTDLRKITESRIDEYSPEWSPNGTQILFISERGSSINSGIYVMDEDGGDARPIYNVASAEWGPSWSADGQQIVFTIDQPNGTANIYVMNNDGSRPRLLVERGGYPSWAVGGQQ